MKGKSIKVYDIEIATKRAHDELDKWIAQDSDPFMPFDDSVIQLGTPFMNALVNARYAHKHSRQPETVEVNGKKYLLSDINKLKEIK